MKYYLLFTLLIPFGISAQSFDSWVIGSGGESSSGSGIQLSWTLGEPNIASISKNQLMITEGFHQSYIEVIALNPIKSVRSDLQIRVFPNPAADHVQINLADNVPKDFDLRLFDSKGNLLQFHQFLSTHNAALDLGSLPDAVYLISIQINDQLPSMPHSFQIIKH